MHKTRTGSFDRLQGRSWAVPGSETAPGPVESQVAPRVEGRRDAEDADQRRGVCRPVADRAAGYAGFGDLPRAAASEFSTRALVAALHGVGHLGAVVDHEVTLVVHGLRG